MPADFRSAILARILAAYRVGRSTDGRSRLPAVSGAGARPPGARPRRHDSTPGRNTGSGHPPLNSIERRGWGIIRHRQYADGPHGTEGYRTTTARVRERVGAADCRTHAGTPDLPGTPARARLGTHADRTT